MTRKRICSLRRALRSNTWFREACNTLKPPKERTARELQSPALAYWPQRRAVCQPVLNYNTNRIAIATTRAVT